MTKIQVAQVPGSKHFCILPWIHLQLYQDGRVFPCCRMNNQYSYGSVKEKPVEAIWNDVPIREIRKKLIEDQPFDHCRQCYELERMGVASGRVDSNREFAHHLPLLDRTREDGTLETDSVPFLDVRLSNVCNFKCRTCGPEWSSSWRTELLLKKDGNPGYVPPIMRSGELFRPFLERAAPFLQKIWFIGGEPLLEPEHYRLLERLIEVENTDVVLDYSTNFSTLRLQDWSVIGLWSRFKRVNLYASLDGVGAKAELIRKGTRWADIEANFKELRDRVPHVKFCVFPTLSVLNAFHILGEALDHWIGNGMICHETSFQLNILRNPDELSVSVLNQSERELLERKHRDMKLRIEKVVSLAVFQMICRETSKIFQYLNSQPLSECREKFRQTTARLDRVRNENTQTVLPELGGALEK